MARPAGKTASVVVGVVVLLVGLVWVGQGLGYLPGSFMSGDMTWFWIGLMVGVVGLFLVLNGLRRPPRSR